MIRLTRRLIFIFLIVFGTALNAASKPYVILISYDAFRWDYINRNITKTLNKVAEDGVSAVSLRPAFPSKTFPNHLSLITGMYTAHHGIISNSFINPFKKTDDGSELWYRRPDTNSTRESRWYLGETFWETAERQGIITASYFWPGANMIDKDRHPTYVEKFEQNRPDEDRIKKVEEWLSLPQDKRPHFISLYFYDTDEAGHYFGPNSNEVNKAIQKLDTISAMILNKLNEMNLRDSVDVIFLSDHGMTEISKEKEINIEKIIGDSSVRLFDEGPFMSARPAENKIETVYKTIKQNENHYKVYLKEEVPFYYHYSDNAFIAPIVIIADLGWSLTTNKSEQKTYNGKGDHGFDNNELDMHGFFIATGPSFKKTYHTGTLWNIDVYPLLCKIFNITPRSNIDGNLERIEFILK